MVRLLRYGTIFGPLKDRWRYLYKTDLYRRRLEAGPEPERARSALINWNFDAELYACSHRFSEKLSIDSLKRAMTDASFISQIIKQRTDAGLTVDDKTSLTFEHNEEISKKGQQIADEYLHKVLKFWYPKFPNDGIDAVVKFLLSESTIADISSGLGFTTLIRCDTPKPNSTMLSKALFAFIATIDENNGRSRANLFVADFILTYLVGKDINEIWEIKNPMGLLTQVLEKNGRAPPESRLIWTTGVSSLLSTYIVGIYSDKEFIGKSAGATIPVAEEMAARDALRRLFETDEKRAAIPFDQLYKKGYLFDS